MALRTTGVALGDMDVDVRAELEKNPGLSLQQAQDLAARNSYSQRTRSFLDTNRQLSSGARQQGLQNIYQQTLGARGSGATTGSRPSMQSLSGNPAQDAIDARGREDSRAQQEIGARRDDIQLQSKLRREEMEFGSGLRKNEFDRRAGVAKSMYGETPAQVEYEGPIQGQEDAARSAAFARAKEMAAMNARASMAALEDVSAENGMMGSTMAAQERGRVVGGAQTDVSDFVRDEMIQNLGRARETANMRYQGGITQRGQNINRQNSLLGLLTGSGLY